MSQVATGIYPTKRVAIYWGANDPSGQEPLQGPLTFDATLNESHDREADVTDYPVEEGANVADHVRPKPWILTLETFVSNQPLNSTDAQRQGLYLPLDPPLDAQPSLVSSQAAQGANGPTIGAQVASRLGIGEQFPASINPLVDQFTGAVDYVKNAFDQLSQLQQSAALLRIITPRQPAYSNMVIKSLRMRRDKDAGTGAYITIDFVQIRIVASQVVPAPAPTVLRATPPAPVGQKDATTADAGKQSVARKLLSSQGLYHPPS